MSLFDHRRLSSVFNPKLQRNLILDSSTSSKGSLDMAHRWYTACRQEHSECDRRNQSFWPTRLLKFDNSQGSSWKLVINSNNTHVCPGYVTLSHRWGSNDFLRLEKSNAQSLEAGRPLAELPQTFKDAINVAKRFGINYLWIDSLCIIQDSTEDWQRESAVMGDIYKNAILNVAATHGSSSDKGLFVKRDIFDVLTPVIEANWPNRKHEKYAVIDTGLWADSLAQAPLNRRGWVLQERVLSHRILHFGAEQIFWECYEADACETHPNGLPLSMRTLGDRGEHRYIRNIKENHDSNIEEYYNGHRTKDTLEAVSLCCKAWSRILGQYSNCSLTVSEDKLVALSGIARLFQEAMGVRYLAGLWDSFLVEQLLWYVDDCKQINGAPSFKPVVYRAPSWSWASVEGKVHGLGILGPKCRGETLIDVLRAETTSVTDESCGQVVAGFIQIRGILLSISCSNDTFWKDPCISLGLKQFPVSIKLDVRFMPESSVIRLAPMMVSPPILRDEEHFVEGLLLQCTNVIDEYTRLGHFAIVSSTEACKLLGMEIDSSGIRRCQLESHDATTIYTII